jgi:hypothetical protein
MGSPSVAYASGNFTCAGTPANIDIKCGFTPKHVWVYLPDGTNGILTEWWEGMADGAGIKNANATGIITEHSSTGITPLALGFRIGTGAQYASLAGKWQAIG